jgi:hypothetical protein
MLAQPGWLFNGLRAGNFLATVCAPSIGEARTTSATASERRAISVSVGLEERRSPATLDRITLARHTPSSLQFLA